MKTKRIDRLIITPPSETAQNSPSGKATKYYPYGSNELVVKAAKFGGLVLRALVLLIICLFAAVFASAQTAGNGIEEVYLARDDGNGKAGEAVSGFFTTDIPIYCVVQLDSTRPVTVKLNFVAVAVSGVKPGSKVVTTAYTTKDGQDRVNFTGKPAEKWIAGKYRVDIFIDGKLAKDLIFDIRPASGNLDGAAYLVPKTAKPKPSSKTKKNY